MFDLELLLKESYKYVYSIIDRILGYPFQKKTFYKNHGYHLNLRSPQSFNEKVVWKKLNDKNPILPITADKIRVREYLIEKLGTDEAKKIMIPLLYVTKNPQNIPFDKLPERYIIKSNFGSGKNLIINDKTKYTKEDIINITSKWLKKSFGVMYHEWAYQQIERNILIEELLLDENGNIPKDYKFFVFNGRCKMIQVDFDRFTEHTRTLYSRDWEMLPVTYGIKQGIKISKPNNYETMLNLAERLGKDFDFVRIDFYSIRDKVYFGEITHYPLSGMGKFTPQSFDFDIGKNWKLVPFYWNKH